MADDKNSSEENTKPNSARLPMRKEMEDGALEHKPAGKDINDTFGGKIMHFFTFYVIGWVTNAALSLGITYFLNPQPGVQKAKEKLIKRIAKEDTTKIEDSVRSGVEISFMMLSGTAVTLVMAPLIKYRGILAYKINKLFKKDLDVLPQELQPVPEPKTVEDAIEQAINKHVKKHSAWDIWIPRGIGTGIILFGDNRVNAFSRLAENKNSPWPRFSVDTLSWGLGKQIYKILRKSGIGDRIISGSNNFFKNHGASIQDIKKTAPDHYARLHKHGNVDNSDKGMMVAEQTRLVAKEIGWSLAMARLMEFMTQKYRDHRIHKQEQKIIGKLTGEGVVPPDHVAVVENGHVRLDFKEGPHSNEKDSKSWTKGQNPLTHTEAMKGRMTNGLHMPS